MAIEVLRPQNILLPPQRIRTNTSHRGTKPGAKQQSTAAAASTAGRRQHGRPSSYGAKMTSAAPARRPAVEVYAGPAFSAASPEPSSLPQPQFPFKKAEAVAVVNDAATRDLRRMLRLE